ncbi:SpaA isopeptide-forming pilin-related protein [Corynebacterium sp.]|uniref:SpaA isopeptide-forming pilin-related protein n=1 Tax=Corynebacterium sp. TaxID=1720 RepID=UPI0026DD31D2|nr:SpaA isopeptide-forming pilin-related protein [Corynebacterium sp.]MDO5077744.1 SpaA isopeptide-forming pilin-related protein [Corynebacterium sp.]
MPKASSPLKRVVRAAAATVAVVAFVTLPSAHADSHTVMGNSANLEVASIDTTRAGALTLVKAVGERPQPAREARFTAKRIQGIDLTHPAGWESARSMTVAQAVDAKSDYIDSAYTDAAGEAKLSDLPLGLYLVTETVPGNTTARVEPFLLTIPSGSVDGRLWEYHVRVAAKAVQHAGADSDSASNFGLRKRERSLASTGAQVLGVLAVGVGLVLGGLVLRRIR